jgi:hypothetical protein
MKKNVNQKFVKTETNAGGNALLGLASKTKKTAAAKKDDKEIVTMDGTVSDAIDSYIKNKKIADQAAGEMAAASEIVKNEGGKKVWIAEMEKTGRSKESFILASKNGNSLMYVVTDAYKRSNLDEERIEYLQTTYGENIISTDNKFIINPELIDKYGQALCDFIKTSPLIAAEDKETLIQLEQKHVIAKGTKDKLKEIATTAGTTVEAVFEEIQPTCQVKVRGSK